MEFAPIQVSTTEYIITSATGNIISRKSKLFGIDNVSLGGQVRFSSSFVPIQLQTASPLLIISTISVRCFKCIIEEGATLHGDYAEIELGLNCYVGKNVLLAPTAKQIRGFALSALILSFSAKPNHSLSLCHLSLHHRSTVHLPMRISDHVICEEGAIVRALSIGSNTYIGKNAVIVRCSNINLPLFKFRVSPPRISSSLLILGATMYY